MWILCLKYELTCLSNLTEELFLEVLFCFVLFGDQFYRLFIFGRICIMTEATINIPKWPDQRYFHSKG